LFPRKDNNESGVVLVTVLAISLIMITLVVGFLSTNLNFVNVGQGQIDRIKVDQLAKQTFWRNFMSLTTGNGVVSTPLINMPEVTDGHTASKPFTPNIIDGGLSTAPGLNNTRQYNIQVSY